jgi:hypothetical protein
VATAGAWYADPQQPQVLVYSTTNSLYGQPDSNKNQIFKRGSIVFVTQQHQKRGEENGADTFGVDLGSHKLLILKRDLKADDPLLKPGGNDTGFYVIGQITANMDVIDRMSDGDVVQDVRLGSQK